jgi:thiol-disulfide isomerase/thioredoxin
MHKMRRLILILMVLVGMSVFELCAAQEHTPSAEAKAAFDKARELPFGDKEAVALYRKAIDLDPDYSEAHQYYILTYANSFAPQTASDDEKKVAADKARKELEEMYQKWASEHPDKAVYQWALGDLLDYEDPDKAVDYYKKAIALDSKYAPAYDMLGIAAEEHGDLELSRELERKAHESWPNNVTFWRHYMGSWVDADLDKSWEIALQMTEKFPADGTSMLGYVAGRTTDEAKAREMYETIRQRFPAAATGYALMPLFNIYLKTDPAKALALAEERAKSEPKSKEWPVLKDYAQTVITAPDLIAEGKSGDVIAALDKLKLPSYGADRRRLDLTRANALDAGGQTEQAYSGLIKVFASTPSDDIRAALFSYGKKLGKDAGQVEADIRTQRSASAKPGIPFSLVNYATGKPVSLDDYKGSVVLVNFWYPKCGPCRGEFPYLQMALEKYKSQGFEILAINGHPPEDGWVMPLIKGWKLGFKPLKGTEDIIKAYKVRGFPSNFLYGPDGRIYPMPSQVRPATLREFELQVEALLKQAKSPTAEKSSLPNEPKTVAESLDAVKKYRDALLRENHDAMRDSDDFAKMVGQKVIGRAREHTLLFPLDKTPNSDLMNLARLYMEAGQPDKARGAVARRLSDSSLSDTQRADLLAESIEVALTGNDPETRKKILPLVDDSLRRLDAMGNGYVRQQITAYRSAAIVYSRDNDRLEKASNRYVELYKKLSPADHSANLRFGVYKAYTNLAKIYGDRGENDRAKAAFQEGTHLLSLDRDAASTLSILKYDFGRFELPGQKAAPIEADYWINRQSDGQPLDLTGKVTLIEFTAHWCVPCRETYPAMKRLNQKYADRGVQVLFATSLYGYFGKDRNLTPDQEFADDKKYFTDEWKLPFEVAVKAPEQREARTPGWDKNSRSYFSQGIPQFVIVDRKGIVRYVGVDWESKTEQLLSSVLEKALSNSKN